MGLYLGIWALCCLSFSCLPGKCADIDQARLIIEPSVPMVLILAGIRRLLWARLFECLRLNLKCYPQLVVPYGSMRGEKILFGYLLYCRARLTVLVLRGLGMRSMVEANMT